MTQGPASLPDDASASDVLAWLDQAPSFARIVAASRRLDAYDESHPGSFEHRNVLVIRNFTLEPIEAIARVSGYRRGIRLGFGFSGYAPTVGGELPRSEPGFAAVVVALRLEALAPALTTDILGTPPERRRDLADAAVAAVVDIARDARQRLGAPVFVHNFVSASHVAGGFGDAQQVWGQANLLRSMNVELAREVAAGEGLYLLDADLVLSRAGLERTYDGRGDRTSAAPLRPAGLEALGEAWARHVAALRGPAVKCVIVDCDNTLWGGVVGEDGIGGIVLGDTGAGARHRELQHDLLDLRRRGIVLAICSRNEEADVLHVLRNHPDCLLKETDFAAIRVNWESKAENILAIAEELNLGVGQIAFLDDDPTECDRIRTRLPDVHVVQWPHDLAAERRLDDLALFDSLVQTEEDRQRTDLYRAEANRRSARDTMTSEADFLRSLELVATVGLAGAEHLPRLAQLTQRTNQFNLTTRRYDQSELAALAAAGDSRVIWLGLRDRFGDHGVVGCAVVRCEGDVGRIDTLLLSCRVLGRQVEAVLLAAIAREARAMGATTLVGEYVASARNGQVAEMYGRFGFTGPTRSGDTTTWSLALSDIAVEVPDWFDVVEVQDVVT